MFKSLLFIVFIIVFAIYFISIKIRQYPKNQDDPNIKLRRIESACGIINIATFAILLSSSSLYAFKVPEINRKGNSYIRCLHCYFFPLPHSPHTKTHTKITNRRNR